MPQVIHSFKGENRQPRLKVCKAERFILENASGLCRAIEAATVGYHAELSAEARNLASRLERLAEIEIMDLSKPW